MSVISSGPMIYQGLKLFFFRGEFRQSELCLHASHDHATNRRYTINIKNVTSIKIPFMTALAGDRNQFNVAAALELVLQKKNLCNCPMGYNNMSDDVIFEKWVRRVMEKK